MLDWRYNISFFLFTINSDLLRCSAEKNLVAHPSSVEKESHNQLMGLPSWLRGEIPAERKDQSKVTPQALLGFPDSRAGPSIRV